MPIKKKAKKTAKKSKKMPVPKATAFRGRHEPAAEALKGNRFWERRTKHGRDKLFSTPDILLEECQKHFNDVEEHDTIYTTEFKVVDRVLEEVKVPHPAPFTWEKLCMYLGVSRDYFRKFKVQMRQDDPHREGFIRVIEWVEQTIYSQKFDKAAVGVFNANLISYDLGIRKDMAISTGGGGLTINVESKKDQNDIEEVRRLLAESDKE